MISFLLKHWRPLLALACIVGAFAVGRYTTPGPDVVIAESIRFVEKRVEVKVVEKAKAKIVYRDVVTKPDGTKIDRSVESSATDTRIATDTVTARDGASDRKETVSAYKPQWRVGALLGVDAGAIARSPLTPSYSWISAGAFAERRIVGPFFVGLWALSSGPSFGLTLSVEF